MEKLGFFIDGVERFMGITKRITRDSEREKTES